MKFNYQFSNLCGSVYKQGNVVFTPDGNTVLSPVGNRITVFDLVNHTSSTLPLENRKNISRLALSPNGRMLLSIDEDGAAILVNFLKRVVLCEFQFQGRVRDVKFSPDNKFIAVNKGRQLQVWKTPAMVTQFRPFALHRTYTGHYEDITCITWSPDSKFFVTGSRDNTARVHSLDSIVDFHPLLVTGHRNHIIGCYFGRKLLGSEHDTELLYTVSKDGALFVWRFEPHTAETLLAAKKGALEAKATAKAKGKQVGDKTHSRHMKKKLTQEKLYVEAVAAAKKGKSLSEVADVPVLARGRYVLDKKHFFKQNHAKVISCGMHTGVSGALLVVGFDSGVFAIYEVPDFNCIHTLSISQKQITAIDINCSGQWLAFGCQSIGQLLVWEWQSESYVLKQQGHLHGINTLDYSPDGQLIVTGGDDGKVKLWNTSSGFCFVTFNEHKGPVSSVMFSGKGTAVFSSSLDGTVRAYDLVRYRLFRVMTSPEPTQFTSLCVDPSGELVCAGSLDSFQIYVWNVQTGRLLDVLAGHEAPVSGLSFSTSQSLLASSSWDKTVRLWDVFNGKGAVETLTHTSDILALSFRPDGLELAACGLDGNIYFWDVVNGLLTSTIEGKKDIMGGRRRDDARASKNATHSTCFNSICYSADGLCVLAGGNSKFVCIYEVSQKILLKKFVTSSNQSLDGLNNFLNSKYMTEAGNIKSLDLDDPDDEERLKRVLPGAQKGDFSDRKTPQVARTKAVVFSPTGLQWAAAATEGLLIYSLDEDMTFDPSDLGVDVTPASVTKRLKLKDYSAALLMSLSLNETPLIEKVIEATPRDHLQLVVRCIPLHRLHRVLELVAICIGRSPQLEFYLLWAQTLLTVHGRYLRSRGTKLLPSFRALQKTATAQYTDISKICEENQYMLEYLSKKRIEPKPDEDISNDISISVVEVVPSSPPSISPPTTSTTTKRKAGDPKKRKKKKK